MARDMPNAAWCGMLCGEPLFRAFLKWKLGEHDAQFSLKGDEPWLAVRDKDHAALAARHLLKVESRRELNDGPGAVRWNELRGDFDMWKRGYYD